jgi:hypothetical protein
MKQEITTGSLTTIDAMKLQSTVTNSDVRDETTWPKVDGEHHDEAAGPPSWLSGSRLKKKWHRKDTWSSHPLATEDENETTCSRE